MALSTHKYQSTNVPATGTRLQRIMVLLAAIFTVFFSNYAQAQSCCITNRLFVGTGYDPNTFSVIGDSTRDPEWTITGLSPDNAVYVPGGVGSLPYAAWSDYHLAGDGCGPNTWINFTEDYCDTTTDTGTYSMTLQRCFYLCQADSVKFNFWVRADDWITVLSVSGIALAPAVFPQPEAPTTLARIHVDTTVYLPAGKNCITVTVNNYPNNTPCNGSAFDLCGYVSTPSADIMEETSACASWPYCMEPAITGPPYVCAGGEGTTTLSDAYTGGTWTSGNTGIATVGAASGIVTGVGSGTVVITYTDPCSRKVTATVTVIPTPAIGTVLTVCAGSTVALTASPAMSGSTWATSSATATVTATTGIVTGLSAGTATITYTDYFYGCTGTAVVTVNPTPTITTSDSVICIGDTTTYSIDIAGGDWSSSNSSVATVSDGIVTGAGEGIATISYTLPTGCFATMPVTAEISPSAIFGPSSMCVGSPDTLSDTSFGGGTWSSSVTAVATVDSMTGVVYSGHGGTTIITFTNHCGHVTKTIKSHPVPIVAITATYPVICGGGGVLDTLFSHVIDAGGGLHLLWTPPISACITCPTFIIIPTFLVSTTIFSLQVSDTFGCFTIAMDTVTVTPAPPILGSSNVCVGAVDILSDTLGGPQFWYSSAPGVATVDTNMGIVTGITPGTAVITYAGDLGCYGLDTITVFAPPTAISGSATLCAGATVKLADGSGGGVWSSSNTLIATVDSTYGVVTGEVAGIDTIIYMNLCGNSTYVITVNPAPAPIMGPDSICAGVSVRMIDVTPGGTWTVSPTSVATITLMAGVLTGTAGEAVAVTYTSRLTGCFATDNITVNPLPPPITATSTYLCVGNTLSVIDSAETTGAWSSSDTTIATVIDTSPAITTIITGVSAGIVTITFTLPTGCYVTEMFNVIPPPAPITGHAAVCAGATIILADGTSGGAWSMTSTAIATITGSSGKVSGITMGIAVATYTISSTGCYVTDSITVDSLPLIAAISGPDTLCAGGIRELTDAYPGGIWSSLNTAIATVSTLTGVVSGVSGGAVTIVYTISNDCGASSVSQSVYVRPLPTVLPISGNAGVCMGVGDTLQDATPGGVWTSGDATIATIDSLTGIATGVSTGLVNVYYTVINSCGGTSVYKTLSVNMPPYITTNFVVACQSLGTLIMDFIPGPPAILSSGGCHFVCDSSTVRYYGNGPGGTYTWDVIGGTVVSDYGDSIDVFWGIAGITGSVILYDTVSHCTGEDSICVQVIQKPQASFVQSADTVCLNSTIYFTSTSTADSASPILHYYWFYSDGTFSEGASTSHEFLSIGIDTITLVVINGCGCSDTTRMVDTVSNTPGPVIVCPSLVCDSQSMTYSTAADACAGYNWSVTGGTITSGLGTANITVDWNSPGANDEGYVSLVEPCAACPDVTTIQVPIVTETATISGPASFCAGAQNIYSLPLWPATTYSWGVLGCPSCIVTSRGDNTVGIEFPLPGVYTIHGWYQNKIKLCGGNVTTTVNVLPVTNIVGNLLTCENAIASYTLADGLSDNWTLQSTRSAWDTTETGGVFTYTFPDTGSYELSASGNACTSPITIVVSTPPPGLDGITGPDTVCLGRVYSYTTGPGDYGSTPEWSITGGTLYPASGYTVNVVWTSTGTKVLRAWRRKNLPPYCAGPVDTMTVIQEATSSAISGDTAVCANTRELYTCSYRRGESYSWTIVPNAAGSILWGTDTSTTALISWQNTATTDTAYVTLTIHKCDSVYNDTLAVRINPDPVITVAGTLTACPGTLAGFGASPGDSVYIWDPGDGSPLQYTRDSLYWEYPSNTSTGDVNYTINVTGIPYAANTGCVPVSEASTNIAILPGPVVNVTSGTWYICDTTIDTAVLIGTVTNNVSGVTFQWYKNSAAIAGATDTFLNVEDYASYYFTATAGDGCMIASNGYTVDSCPPPSTPRCGIVDAYGTNSCDTAYLTGIYVGGSHYSWQIYGAVSYSSGLTTPNAVVVYDTPGVYQFIFAYISDTCGGLHHDFFDTIAIVPNFLYQERCAAAGTDSILLQDHTSFLPGWSVDTVYWFYGSTLIGTGSNISLVLSAPSSITITEVVHAHGPDGYKTCQVPRTITLPAQPVAFFTGNFIHGPFCEGENCTFGSESTGGIDRLYWDFGDGSSSLLFFVEKTFTWIGPIANPQPFPVTLTVTDTLGCVDSVTDTAWVWHNTLDGFLGPNQTVCSNDAPVILSWINDPRAADTPNRFVWSNGVSNQTGIDTITQSGAYWVTVSDTATQCHAVFPRPDDVEITIVPMPTAEFMGLQNYCIGDSIQLYSDAGSGVALRWFRNDTANGTGTSINDVGLPPGAYDYQLIASVTESSLTCADTSAVDTTHIYALPPAPVITGPVPLNCSTYLELLTATEPMDGNYNWSNGATGARDSTHSGGLYRVWFTDLEGCINHADTTVPPSAESFFEYFPIGCYALCTQQLPLTLYGPPGDTLNYWAWIKNGDTLSSGTNSLMLPLAIDSSSGSYTWYLSNGGCGQLSDTMNVTAIDCPQCPPEPMSVTITCLTDTPASYQVYISATSPVPPGSTYTVGTDMGPIIPFSGTVTGSTLSLTLTFTTFYFTAPPSPDSVTIEISYTVPGGTNCVEEQRVALPATPCDWRAERQSGDTTKNNLQPTISNAMAVFPNPTSGDVTISYDYGSTQYNERNISIFDAMGRKIATTVPQDVAGNWNLNTNDWSPGIYIIRMEADGKALQTQRMVVVSK